MTLLRAFTIVHLLDVPETKRLFWPQWATVVINRDGTIEDVIQHFAAPTLELNKAHMDLYPASVQFTVCAGKMFTSFDDFSSKVRECISAHANY